MFREGLLINRVFFKEFLAEIKKNVILLVYKYTVLFFESWNIVDTILLETDEKWYNKIFNILI